MAFERMWSKKVPIPNKLLNQEAVGVSSKSSSCTLKLGKDSDTVEDATMSFQLQPGTVDHLQLQYADTLVDSEVSFSIFTEMYVSGDLYRAHPNYQQRGPWYDWVIV